MEVSSALTKEQNVEWLHCCETGIAVLGGILNVMHPALYQAGIDTMQKLAASSNKIKKGHLLKDILKIWASPYGVINIISNQQTPVHRDNGSSYSCMDTLVTVGDYQDGTFEIPGLGIDLRYAPGTIIGISSRILRHGAKYKRDRACIAFYMKESVMSTVGISSSTWMNISSYSYM